jgi:hypothetical protein
MNIASTACRALGRGLVVMANVKLLAKGVLFGRKSILRSLLVINSRPELANENNTRTDSKGPQ